MLSFIHQQYLSDLSICDEIIESHKNSPDKRQGVSGDGTGYVNIELKDSTDVSIDTELFNKYYVQLHEVVEEYIKIYPASAIYGPWGVRERPVIQYYKPGGGFKAYHAERTSSAFPFSHRHLVFMTYLNDVTDMGGTEFYNQQLVTEARKGLTLIWPVDWTHLHRGVVSPTQEKYIVTGWFSYTE